MRAMTQEFLEAAFAGESQAHMKYLAFADAAEKEGKPRIANLYRAIAFAERVHATLARVSPNFPAMQIRQVHDDAEFIKENVASVQDIAHRGRRPDVRRQRAIRSVTIKDALMTYRPELIVIPPVDWAASLAITSTLTFPAADPQALVTWLRDKFRQSTSDEGGR